MSSNPFAALDDSGDEAPPKKAPVSKKKATTVAPSKVDPKSKPKNNDRNTKHGRGGRPPARDGKRTYDRRSGTGRGKEIKKGGGGARNWGSDKNEAKKAEGRINNENEEIAETPLAADAEEAEAPAQEEKVEDNTMTYADYMASKAKKEEVVLRETKNEFAGVTAATKGEEESFMSMGVGKKKKEKKQKEAKKTIDVGFRVAKANSGGEGRGDRKDGRGGRGRGDRKDGRGRGRGGRGGRGSGRGPRGPKKPAPAGLNVQDATAFPSL